MKLPSFTCFRLTKLSSVCLVLLMTSQNASAFDLEMGNLSTSKISSHSYYDGLISKLPTLFIFEEKNAAEYLVSVIRNDYLTFYSTKNENLKATYAGGAYLIKYTSNW